MCRIYRKKRAHKIRRWSSIWFEAFCVDLRLMRIDNGKCYLSECDGKRSWFAPVRWLSWLIYSILRYWQDIKLQTFWISYSWKGLRKINRNPRHSQVSNRSQRRDRLANEKNIHFSFLLILFVYQSAEYRAIILIPFTENYSPIKERKNNLLNEHCSPWNVQTL